MEILAGLPEGFLSEHTERITREPAAIIRLCEGRKSFYQDGYGAADLPLDWTLARMLDRELAMELIEQQVTQPVWQWVNEGEAEAVRRYG